MTKAIILKNISWQTAFQIISNALGLLFNIILARKISQFEFGAYSYIFSLLAIVSLFLELGIPSHYLRKWVTDISVTKNDFANFITSRLLIATPVSVLLFLYVFLIDRFVSLEFLLAYIYILLEIFVQPSRLLFTSQNQFQKTFLIDISERIVSLAGGIVLLLLGQSLRVVLTGFIVGRLLSLAIGFWLARSHHAVHFNLRETWWLIKISLPLFLVSVFSTLYFRVDMLVIRYLLGVGEVGLYSAAYRLLDASALLPSIITTATLPTVIQLFAKKEKHSLHRLFNLMVQTLTIASFHIGICGILYADPVIEFIYSQKFADSAPLLQVLGINALFLFITYPLSHFLVANHQENYYIRILFLLFVANIGLNLFFIPMMGIMGAAVATLITEAVSLILLLKRSQMQVEIVPLIKIMMAGLIGAILVAFIPAAWYIKVFVQTAIYFTIILATKTINITDILPALGLQKYDQAD